MLLPIGYVGVDRVVSQVDDVNYTKMGVQFESEASRYIESMLARFPTVVADDELGRVHGLATHEKAGPEEERLAISTSLTETEDGFQ